MAHFIYILLCVIYVILIKASAESECPEDWHPFQENCYKYSTTKANGYIALNKCIHLEGILVIITSKELKEFLSKKINQADKYWIGLKQTKNNEQFTWSDDSEFDKDANYVSWNSGSNIRKKRSSKNKIDRTRRGTNWQQQQCQFYSYTEMDSSGMWNLVGNCQSMNKYICQKERVVENLAITCPEDLKSTTDPGLNFTHLTWLSPVVSGGFWDSDVTTKCDGDNLMKDTFFIGDYDILCETIDSVGNSVTCTFRIKISDEEKPELICPKDISTNTDPGKDDKSLSFSLEVSDNSGKISNLNCDKGTLGVNNTLSDNFDLGKQTVSCSSSDESGNVATCSFSVNVFDAEPPILTCPKDVEATTEPDSHQRAVTWNDVHATDNVDPYPHVTCNRQSGDIFSIGTSEVFCNAVDASENNNSCKFIVKIKDNQIPTISCPPDIIINLKMGEETKLVSWAAPKVYDNSGIVPKVSCDTSDNSGEFSVGLHMITCKAFDQSENEASCNFNIIVKESPTTTGNLLYYTTPKDPPTTPNLDVKTSVYPLMTSVLDKTETNKPSSTLMSSVWSFSQSRSPFKNDDWPTSPFTSTVKTTNRASQSPETDRISNWSSETSVSSSNNQVWPTSSIGSTLASTNGFKKDPDKTTEDRSSETSVSSSKNQDWPTSSIKSTLATTNGFEKDPEKTTEDWSSVTGHSPSKKYDWPTPPAESSANVDTTNLQKENLLPEKLSALDATVTDIIEIVKSSNLSYEEAKFIESWYQLQRNIEPSKIDEKREVMLYMKACSGVLDDRFTAAWNQVSELSDADGAAGVMSSCSFLLDYFVANYKANDTIRKSSRILNKNLKNIDISVTKIMATFENVRENLTIDEDTSIEIETNCENSENCVYDVSIIQFKTGHLFKDVVDSTQYYPITPVLSITPNLNKQPVSLPVKYQLPLHNIEKNQSDELFCSFWEERSTDSRWSTRGCSLERSDNSTATCKCNHTTSFAVLLQITNTEIPESHELALGYITYVGCGVSLISLLLTVSVLGCIRTLMSDRTKIHLNLCVALIMAQILLLTGISATKIKLLCKIIAVLLHYFYLASFSWMLIEGVHLYLKIVQVFGMFEDKIRTYFLIGWGIPLILVVITAGVDWEGYGTDYSCWLSIDGSTIWAFAAPVMAIILANSVILGIVVKIAVFSAKERENNYTAIKTGLKSSIFLLPILGISWIFGILALGRATLVMQYLFTITNSLQGLMIFLFNCVLSSEVRQAMKRVKEKIAINKGDSFTSTEVSHDFIKKKSPASHSLASELNEKSKSRSLSSTTMITSLESLNSPEIYNDENLDVIPLNCPLYESKK